MAAVTVRCMPCWLFYGSPTSQMRVLLPPAQVRDAGNLLTRAGFTIPSVDTDEVTVHYGRPRELAGHLRRMGEGNAVRARRATLRRATAARADDVYAAKFGAEDGSVPATFQVRPSLCTAARTVHGHLLHGEADSEVYSRVSCKGWSWITSGGMHSCWLVAWLSMGVSLCFPRLFT
jgi:hypothetical protein